MLSMPDRERQKRDVKVRIRIHKGAAWDLLNTIIYSSLVFLVTAKLEYPRALLNTHASAKTPFPRVNLKWAPSASGTCV